MSTDNDDAIRTALDSGDMVEVLALELARDVNNIRAINDGVKHVIEQDLWRSRTVMGCVYTYRSFESFVAAPLSRGGLDSDIKVIIGNAMTDKTVQAVLAPVLEAKTAEDVIAKAKQMEAKRKIENLPPMMTRSEMAKRMNESRYGKKPPDRKDLAKRTDTHRMKELRNRAREGNANAITLLARVERGEISITYARTMLYPEVCKSSQARSKFRALDADQRHEFLQWLKTEGVVTRIDINPAFAGFPKRKPVA
jgi:hypothetical protein